MIRDLLLLSIFFYMLSPCYGQIRESLAKNDDESPIIIDAEQSIVCDETTHKCVATGQASAQKGTSIVYGDVLTVFFTDGKQREIISLMADGHVRLETPTDTAYGDHAHYDAALDRVLLTGEDLKIVTPKETVTAKDSIEYWNGINQGIARGDAIAHFHKNGIGSSLANGQSEESTIYADVLTIDFTEGEKHEVKAIMADGHVRMETPTEEAYGEHAHYDTALDRVIMTGENLKIITPNETLTARDSLEYWRTNNQGIARGNAIARFKDKDQLVQADTLVAYFIPTSEKYDGEKKEQKIDRVEAEGNMLASGPNGIITGDRGIYFEKSNFVEVFNNVKVTQEGNLIEGGYAKANLETNVAEIYPNPPSISETCSKERISGVIYPKDAKKRKNNKDGQIFPIAARKNKDKHVNP